VTDLLERLDDDVQAAAEMLSGSRQGLGRWDVLHDVLMPSQPIGRGGRRVRGGPDRDPVYVVALKRR
jgi:hypothetical protein